jgi:hypothetical protein
MFDFPNSPTVGQVFGNYAWDGQKWTQTSAGIAPSNSNPLMDGAAAPGVSQLYSRGDHVHPSDTSRIARAGDTMSGFLNLSGDPAAALQAATKQYVDAHGGTPILSINGAMAVSQQNGSTAVSNISAPTYVLDQWLLATNGVPRLTGVQAAAAPSIGPTFSLSVVPYTAVPALAAGDAALIYQSIEGNRCARLGWGAAGAQAISIGFFFNSNVAGTATLFIVNVPATRSYLADFAVVVGWQWIALTVPGDVTGTWGTDNTIGMNIGICLGAGTTYRGVAGWQAGVLRATANTTNFQSSSANQVQITGFIAVPGNILPPSANVPFVLPTFDRELAACQRYWNQVYTFARFPASLASQYFCGNYHYPTMRITPAAAVTNNGTVSNMSIIGPVAAGLNSGYLNVQSVAAGDAYVLNAVVALNARL